ncbi:MAG: phosphodiester glycosidase family protein [Clostridia bacterium]|nr:phosphodiester glycosidase family protein [Clostridia bacterium]
MLTDVALIGVCLVVFALFDHVIPVKQQAVAIPQATVLPTATPQPAPVEGDSDSEAAPSADEEAGQIASTEAEPMQIAGDFSAKFADKFTDGEVIQTETSYQSANLNITLSHYEFSVGSYEQVAYVQDIYVRSIDCIHRRFAEDTFGKAITEGVLNMANRSNAVAAVNGDYYGHNNGGIVICDGVLYRDSFGADMQTLVLFRDGTMKCYRQASEFNAEQVMADGAWQSFSFGPIYVNGGSLNPNGYKSSNHDPRTIIGMVEPGHYMFIVVDGRQKGYSEGLTYTESAEFCQKLGLITAFNLDGGKTSQMTFLGRIANQPYKNGREISDIVYVAEP